MGSKARESAEAMSLAFVLLDIVKNDLGNPYFYCYFIVYYYILGVHQLISK